jgi:surface polysaccharide O-acyltransferase-like enzyme
MNINQQRNLWVDYLRSAITVLVIAHHASLAYTTFASFDSNAYINSTHAIVDDKRCVGLDIFENFNDIFFMSLMFFIGGLFLSRSIGKKGIAAFIADRFYRLFLPFILPGTLLMLLAYFPSYYLAHQDMRIDEYVRDFFTTEKWPVGPPWFIWVLFVFNLLFAISFPLLGSVYTVAGKSLFRLANKPFRFILLCTVMTWVLYVPVASQIGAYTWTGIGPFDFQLSRGLLYAGYFIAGVVVGAADFNNGIFAEASSLVRKWKTWAVMAVTVYIILTLNAELKLLERQVRSGHIQASTAWMIYYAVYAFSCTMSCIAFLTAFRRHVNASRSWWNSLSENAYLIYLVHFVFITWTQFMLLHVNVSAFVKFLLVFLLSLLLSWAGSILLRKIALIRRYL